MKINKNKGFTLLELVLVVGLIGLATISIYMYYNKQAIDSNVKTLTQYLKIIDSEINNSFMTNNGFSSLTVANAISSGIVPQQLVNPTQNQIGNLFGGNITFTSVTVAGTPGYGIVLSNVPIAACTKVATTDFASYVQQVLINGTLAKPAASPSTPVTIAASATNCNQNFNTIEFDNIPYRITPYATPSTTPVRPKESWQNIPAIDSAPTSPASSCTGGTTWNGNFCSCPANSQWNGTSCVVYNTVAGNCIYGQGWSQTTAGCATLPATTATNTHYPTVTTMTTTTATPPTVVVGSVSAPTPAYLNSKNLPQTYNTPTNPIIQSTTGTSCTTPNLTPPPGVPGTIPSTVPQGYWDGQSCQTCVYGSWNGYRCVTP
jgi:prepilin-type N-terminal cleavage/methylation domain-containing protein